MTSLVFDFAKSTISRALLGKDIPVLSFTVGDISPDPSLPYYWQLHKGIKKDDNSQLSVFVCDIVKHKDKLSIVKNALKRFKTIRHPDILKFVDGVETDSQILIATESVIPLSSEQLHLLDPNVVSLGLLKIATAIKFLNNDCGIIHGNVKLSSIYTTKGGEWKLGGLDLLCSLKEEYPIIIECATQLNDSNKYSPPEVTKGSWSVVKSIPIHSVDSWMFSLLINEIFNGPIYSAPVSAVQRGEIPEKLFKFIKRLMTTDPKSRSSLTDLLETGRMKGEYFDTEVINAILFLETISLKESNEKEAFLKKITTVVGKFPKNMLTHKLLPTLLHTLEFGGMAAALAPILIISKDLSNEEFDDMVLPVLVRLFGVQDRAIRLVLCDNMNDYMGRINSKVVSDNVWPNLVIGFADLSPVIRESTVKSVLTIITKLNDRIINNDLLKYFAKLQTDEEPGIRCNTTICLGKIAINLNETTRKKVLVPAFIRSLRDPFPPSRNAGLLALSATCEYFDAIEIAQKVIPSISVLLLDTEKNIRIQAFKCMDTLLKQVEKQSQTMPDTAAPKIDPNAPQSNQPIISPTGSDGWTGWAVSALGAGAKITGSLIAGAASSATSTVVASNPANIIEDDHASVKSDSSV
ncbi:hypothetical protein HK096_004190, partial [Nowakowskiella sp. JEL0078]